jgi:D-aminopeptidase
VGKDEVFAALNSAQGGAVAEGAVGAGTGTIAFAWKGGIGTSSRVLPAASGGYTVGVLVQTNYGGVLTMNGAPLGVELGRFYMKEQLTPPARTESVGRDGDRVGGGNDGADGSIMIVVATDAPVDARNLERLASRALMGLARTGSSASNGSGDYVIAFSANSDVRIRGTDRVRQTPVLSNDAMSPLFLAAIEATEEAIYNSLLKATTVTGRGGMKVEALPIDRSLEILRRYGAIKPH